MICYLLCGLVLTFSSDDPLMLCCNLPQPFFVVHVFGRCVNDEPFVPIYHVSKEKAKSLGVSYTPLGVSLKETIESLKEKKFA